MEDDFVPIGSGRARILPQRPILPEESQSLEDDFVPLTAERMAKPQQSYTWGEIPLASVRNLPRSAANFYGGLVEAVANPIDTLNSVLDLGAGTLRELTPSGVRGVIDRLDRNPEAAERASQTARAAGGFYADRYGNVEGFKRALAEDPVGVAADFSTILSGGAAATARVAPRTSGALQTAANVTNPVMPLTQVVQGRVPFTQRTLPEIATTGIGAVQDILSGNAGRLNARTILEQSLGQQNLPAARRLGTSQFDDMTAAEAAASANIFAPEFQALGQEIAGRNPQYFASLQRQREAGRQGLLAAVTPDETAAIANREIASGPLYLRGRDPNALVDQSAVAEIVKNIDRTIEQNRGNSKLRSALNEVKQGLKGSKTASQIASVDDSIRGLLGSQDNAFIQGNLMDVRRQLDTVLPDLQKARQTFAQMSQPVNQAQILNAMQQRLTSPLDIERPGQFMRVLGQGEESLIRTSTGAPRFQQGDLMRILSEEQGQAVTQVSDQLRRQAEMGRQAAEGRTAMQNILETNEALPQRLPNVLDRTIMVINRILNKLSGNVTRNTMETLDQAMRSGADLNQVLNAIPASERNTVLRAINQSAAELSPDKLRNIGVLQQATEAVEEEPFRAELRGMAR